MPRRLHIPHHWYRYGCLKTYQAEFAAVPAKAVVLFAIDVFPLIQSSHRCRNPAGLSVVDKLIAGVRIWAVSPYNRKLTNQLDGLRNRLQDYGWGCHDKNVALCSFGYYWCITETLSRTMDPDTAIEVGAHLDWVMLACRLARTRIYRLFRHMTPPEANFRPEWRTQSVVGLADHIYKSGDFTAMPVLADALQDVGCEEGEILHHLRCDPVDQFTRADWAIRNALDIT